MAGELIWRLPGESILPLFYWPKQFSSDPNLHPLLRQKKKKFCMTFTWTNPIAISTLILRHLMKWSLPILFLEMILVNTFFPFCSISRNVLAFLKIAAMLLTHISSSTAQHPLLLLTAPSTSTSPTSDFTASPIPSPEAHMCTCQTHVMRFLGILMGK